MTLQKFGGTSSEVSWCFGGQSRLSNQLLEFESHTTPFFADRGEGGLVNTAFNIFR